METTITGLIVITVLLLAILTLSYSFLSSQDAILESWREMEQRLGERARTNLSPLGATTDPLLGNTVEVTLRNEGSTKLADFDQWDVILQYIDSGFGDHTKWYPFGAGSNTWGVEGLYLDASEGTEEVFDPDILNPGEEMVIQIWVSPPVGSPTTNLATVATPNGISASTAFTR
jgi:hypothetical protein